MMKNILRRLVDILIAMFFIGYIVFLCIDIFSGLKVGLICIVLALIRFYVLGDKDDGMG